MAKAKARIKKRPLVSKGSRSYDGPAGRAQRARNSWQNLCTRHRKAGVPCPWRCWGEFFLELGPQPYGTTLAPANGSKPLAPGNAAWGKAEGRSCPRDTVRWKEIEIDGAVKTLAMWCQGTGVAYATARERIETGWAPKDAVSVMPLKGGGRPKKRMQPLPAARA